MTYPICSNNPMRRHRSLTGSLAIAIAVVLPATMTACASTDDGDHQQVGSAQHAAPMNMFGGASYQGEPVLVVTVALVRAGGGADNFSFAKALVSMLGEETFNAEVAKLTKQYGEAEVKTFIGGMDLAINLSLKHATQAGVSLPEPAPLSGVELAKALVNAGTAPDGAFWSGYLFDKAVSNPIHHQVMVDINNSAGYEADLVTHKILNQAMYDVAQVLGISHVKLASLH